MTESVSDEDRLREEAARRMERRRRKMLSNEERLAKITGRPVSSESSSNPSSPSDSASGAGVEILTGQQL